MLIIPFCLSARPFLSFFFSSFFCCAKFNKRGSFFMHLIAFIISKRCAAHVLFHNYVAVGR